MEKLQLCSLFNIFLSEEIKCIIYNNKKKKKVLCFGRVDLVAFNQSIWHVLNSSPEMLDLISDS